MGGLFCLACVQGLCCCGHSLGTPALLRRPWRLHKHPSWLNLDTTHHLDPWGNVLHLAVSQGRPLGDMTSLVVQAELLEVFACLQQIPWLTADELRSLAVLLQEVLPLKHAACKASNPPMQLELARLREQWLLRHPGAVQVLLHREDRI